MTAIHEGQRFWKHGNHGHVWVVDAIIPGRAGRAAFAVLVSTDGTVSEDVDLNDLDDRNLYIPAD
jgi:hypothetical protein